MRDRGSVGRRLWRRRRRRTPSEPSAPTDGASEGSASEGSAVDINLDEPSAPLPPSHQKPGPKKQLGLLGRLFASKPRPPPPEPSYLVVDPTRDVLAVPRGAARLDAFERAIKTSPSGTPQFRALALAFHKELQTLAESAGVDLSLYDTRVEACAQALIAAGEEERAGTLFLRVGRRHQAAELFVAAGAIDALEEAHAQIHWDEGGPKHEARMAFERFEALFLVGMREQAFAMLERAHKLWGDNPIYTEIYTSFTERLGKPRRLSLTAGGKELVVVGAWPVIIGRGEDAAVRLTSPLISRAHLRVDLVAGAPVVVDLESRGGTRIAGEALAGKKPLPSGADIDMAGVVVKTRSTDTALWLHAALAPERRTVAALAGAVTVPPPDGLDAAEAHAGVSVRFDERGRAVVDGPVVVNGEERQKPLLLLEGDRLGGWVVTRR